MVQTNEPHRDVHQDPGLQPERTTLAWGRTMASLVTVSGIFLRWLSHYGLPIALLCGISVSAAGAIWLAQRRRYGSSTHGITQEHISADTSAVLWTAFAGISLGGLGIAVVLAG